MLVVGSRDEAVLELNRQAKAMMPGTCELAIVTGATHVFEEAGAMETVAMLARDWFLQHLDRTGAAPGNKAYTDQRRTS